MYLLERNYMYIMPMVFILVHVTTLFWSVCTGIQTDTVVLKIYLYPLRYTGYIVKSIEIRFIKAHHRIITLLFFFFIKSNELIRSFYVKIFALVIFTSSLSLQLMRYVHFFYSTRYYKTYQNNRVKYSTINSRTVKTQ